MVCVQRGGHGSAHVQSTGIGKKEEGRAATRGAPPVRAPERALPQDLPRRDVWRETPEARLEAEDAALARVALRLRLDVARVVLVRHDRRRRRRARQLAQVRDRRPGRARGCRPASAFALALVVVEEARAVTRVGWRGLAGQARRLARRLERDKAGGRGRRRGLALRSGGLGLGLGRLDLGRLRAGTAEGRVGQASGLEQRHKSS